MGGARGGHSSSSPSHTIEHASRSAVPDNNASGKNILGGDKRASTRRATQPVVCLLSAECVPELYEIEIECNRPIWSPQLIANEFRNAHSQVYGARLSGRIVGFLIVHVIFDEAHILNFGIRNSFRGEGIGRVLLVEVIDRLVDEGVRIVTLEVRATNSVARKLYESIGFAEAGMRAHYYTDNGEDALILRLDAQSFLSRRAAGDPR